MLIAVKSERSGPCWKIKHKKLPARQQQLGVFLAGNSKQIKLKDNVSISVGPTQSIVQRKESGSKGRLTGALNTWVGVKSCALMRSPKKTIVSETPLIASPTQWNICCGKGNTERERLEPAKLDGICKALRIGAWYKEERGSQTRHVPKNH